MSKNKLRTYTLMYNSDEDIENDFGMTIEELQRICRDKLEKLGCTKRTIDECIDWDEFLSSVYYDDDGLEYWKKCGVFGDYGREGNFVVSMTTD